MIIKVINLIIVLIIQMMMGTLIQFFITENQYIKIRFSATFE